MQEQAPKPEMSDERLNHEIGNGQNAKIPLENGQKEIHQLIGGKRSMTCNPQEIGSFGIDIEPSGAVIQVTRYNEDGELEFELDNSAESESYLYFGLGRPPLYLDLFAFPPKIPSLSPSK